MMLLVLIGTAFAEGPALTRGPYLQSVTATSAIIVWRTDVAGDTQVDYGVGGYTNSISDTTIATEHVAVLTNLITGTEVVYRVLTNGSELYVGSFRTTVDVNTPFSFAVVGDSGIGSTAQYSVADQMVARDPIFVLHTGDVIYPSGQYAGYDPYFFQPYQTLLRRAPMFLSMGNHDYVTLSGQPYLDTYYLPSNNPANTERYYSFDWGNAHFTALDYNNLSAAQLDWLQTDLSSTDKEWKFVFYHQAIYSSGPHGHESGIIAKRSLLAPIFADNQVDIVFNGHDHDYERTDPITGVVYIVSGGGGNSLYGLTPPIGFSSAYADSIYHHVSVSIDHYTLTVQAVDRYGDVFDTSVITHPAPQAPNTPLGFQVTSMCAEPYLADAAWSVPNDGGSAQGYRIYQFPGPALVWSNTNPIQLSVSQFVTITPNSTTAFQISAYNAVGESGPSDSATIICLNYSIYLPIIYKDWNN
jgi:predicted phosphodiesterase